MKMMGIIFSNIYDEIMGELTKNRTLASLPFGGRYRQIDFILSNMVNSNISSVGVITKYNYQSLMDHLHLCSEWDLNRKNGGLFILPPYGTGRSDIYRGKLEALYGVTKYINMTNSEYVLIAGSNVLCNIDFQPVLVSHIKSGADVTVIGNHQIPEHVNQKCELVFQKEEGEITDVMVKSAFTEDMVCGMGMYIMKKDYLLNLIEDSMTHGYTHLEKDFIQKRFMKHKLKVNLYVFDGMVLRNDDIPMYFKNNMKLLDERVRQDLFDTKSPIYTKVRDEVPTRYGESAVVNDSLIADGCRIDGYVENSILFRDVTIEKGCVIRNAIIMQGTHISEGATIQHTIVDKNVKISKHVALIGAETSPVIVKKGEVIQ